MKNSMRWRLWKDESDTYRIEGGAINGEKRELIDLRPKNSELSIFGSQSKTTITRRKLNLILKKRFLGGKRYTKSKSIWSLNLRIQTRTINIVRIDPFRRNQKKQCRNQSHNQHPDRDHSTFDWSLQASKPENQQRFFRKIRGRKTLGMWRKGKLKRKLG